MPFFNDAFGENMWTLIMKMDDFPGQPKLNLEMMKNLSLMPTPKLNIA